MRLFLTDKMLLVLLLGLIVTGCTLSDMDAGNDQDWTRADFRMLDISRVATVAQDYADEWNSKWIMTEVDLEFVPVDWGTQKLRAYVTFLSSSDPDSWLVTAVEETSTDRYQVIDAREGTYNQPRTSAVHIDLGTEVDLTPLDALEIALEDDDGLDPGHVGAAEWPGSIELRRRDDYRYTGPLLWSVRVWGKNGSPSQYIHVMDMTGEVVSSEKIDSQQ